MYMSKFRLVKTTVFAVEVSTVTGMSIPTAARFDFMTATLSVKIGEPWRNRIVNGVPSASEECPRAVRVFGGPFTGWLGPFQAAAANRAFAAAVAKAGRAMALAWPKS